MRNDPEELCAMLPEARPLLIVLSGPSGVGKDAVIMALKRLGLPIHFTVTVTTRSKRSNEVDGVDYCFTSPEEFVAMRERGELLEWALVHGNFYGTPVAQIRRALENSQDALLKIDVQGAAQVKKRIPDAVFIFLAPPSFEELIRRLCSRGTESESDRERRTNDAREEMRHLSAYDYVVVNWQGKLEQAVEQIKAIITAEKLRVHAREITL
jgi:guanylate kinase